MPTRSRLDQPASLRCAGLLSTRKLRRVHVPSIRSSRLELVSLGPDVLGWLLDGRREDAAAAIGAELPDGWPDEQDARLLDRRAEQLRSDPELQPWLLRALVLDETETMIGHAGFHGPPGVNGPERADAVEVGYSVFHRYRGGGYATEAVRALVAWAREQRVGAVIASVAPDNEPSLAIVRKLGFVQTGEQWDDEDGLELVFQLEGGGYPTPQTPAAP